MRTLRRWLVLMGLLLVGCFSAIHSSAGAATPDRLILRFDTGGDDLRGGNDNLHVILLRAGGTQDRFLHVNGGQGWSNNTSHTVALPLPPGIRFEDLSGVRLETTLSGGVGGDNWNLDRLVVSARINETTRVLLDQFARPLVRFTGDQRVASFGFPGAAPAAPAPRVMTGFRPEAHGFRFDNGFKNIVISQVNWFSGGLCGGMVYSALDYFRAGQPRPEQDYMPAEGTPLHQYLYGRQAVSLLTNLDKWGEHGFNLGGNRNREFFNWGLQAGSGRLGELRDRIDRGQPVPLGLQSCGDECRCAGGCPGNHQVLAIGYELGRYAGDLGAHIEDFSIFVYDPNHQMRTMTLKADASQAMYSYAEAPNDRWRAYFVDAKYSPVTPARPAPAARNELVATFLTGADDLRGINDNVHLILWLRDGRVIRFDTINERRRWIDGSSQSASRRLPDGLSFTDLAGLRLETTFGGGMGGDNWNLDALQLRITLGGDSRILVDRRGTPLFRFTGQQRVFDLPL